MGTVMTPIKTDERLSLAMQFVREGSVVADIGTDHGYIPVALLTGGVCPFAYASDVNAMPLDKARANAEKYGVSDRVSLHLSDGLRFIDEDKTLPEHPVDDIVICGMGGELIAEIVSRSAYAKKSGVRLIIGKGGMDAATLAAMKKHGCVYIQAVGGAAALSAAAVKQVAGVSLLKEFGAAEAVWHFDVEDFRGVVAMDAHGRSLFDEVRISSEQKLKGILK